MVGTRRLDYPIAWIGIGIGKAAAHMARDRIIDCIGASDEDIAHLRLLIRTATQQLRDNWQWGTEDKADIVIVNAHSLIGYLQQAVLTWRHRSSTSELADREYGRHK